MYVYLITVYIGPKLSIMKGNGRFFAYVFLCTFIFNNYIICAKHPIM